MIGLGSKRLVFIYFTLGFSFNVTNKFFVLLSETRKSTVIVKTWPKKLSQVVCLSTDRKHF